MNYAMTHRGEILDPEDFFQILVGYDAIFLGEEHGVPLSHAGELTIFTALVERNPELVLALEMFERDVQNILDAYLSGRMGEEEFLQKARPWPNYATDYRPLVELAKVKGIPVIAANLPRRAAAAVAAANKISPKVLGPDKCYLPQALHFTSREYRKRFMATLGEMPPLGPMTRLKPQGLYKAQVLKDAVMAASLEAFLDRQILFFCGHFHSDYHLGIPYQLHKNHPELKIAVISMASSLENLPMKERSRVADFIWIDE